MKKVCLILSLSLIFWGCKSVNDKKVKISVLGENAATLKAMMSRGKDYEARHPGVMIDFKPNTFEDAFSKANQDFANKTGLYDIVMQYNLSLSSFVRNHYIQDIDELLKDVPDSLKSFEKDLFPEQWQEVGYYYRDESDPKKGIMKVGYPFAANTMLLMYNKQLFNDETNRLNYKNKFHKVLTVPNNWQDFYNVAQFFSNKDNGTYGVCLEGSSNGALYMEWMNYLYGMNGKLMDHQRGWGGGPDSKVRLNSPEALTAMKFYLSLKPFNAGNFTNVEFNEQMNIMKKGKTAMSMVWSDVIFPAMTEDRNFAANYGFEPVPGGRSVANGGAYFINKQSKNPQDAALYIIDLLQPKTQIELAKRGLCSPSRKVYEDKEVQKLPYTKALQTSLERGGVILEAGPDANMITEVVTTYLQKAWSGELTPEQALNMAQTEIVNKRKDIYAKLKSY